MIVLFQKKECGGRPAGLLTTWGSGYSSAHYCLEISAELFHSLRYDDVDTGEVDEIGNPIITSTPKQCTYLLNIERLLNRYPLADTQIVTVDDATLVKEVPLG